MNCRCLVKALVEAIEHVVEGLGECAQLLSIRRASTRAVG